MAYFFAKYFLVPNGFLAFAFRAFSLTLRDAGVTLVPGDVKSTTTCEYQNIELGFVWLISKSTNLHWAERWRLAR